jgi:hypothetical protein
MEHKTMNMEMMIKGNVDRGHYFTKVEGKYLFVVHKIYIM